MKSAIVLAGGHSSRFGGMDKSLLRIGNKTMVECMIDNLSGIVDEIIIAVSEVEQGERIISTIGRASIAYDSIVGFGPIAGILAGMKSAKSEYVATVACDMPFVDPDVVELLFSLAEGHDGAVPKWADGNFEPLHAVYRRESMMIECERAIQRGENTIMAPLRALNVRYVPIEEDIQKIDAKLRTFVNVNTPDELEEVSI
ncbi:MAG: molybdenum cofactor guanylyltransferase [Methanocellales archaeon]|nr:molybdenum cofactor guanylyltransferase [Methanocellales archaeon]